MNPLGWWRDAVVYQVYPRSFQDSDGDGIGDLRGIASRLDHLTALGVDALWLSPIYRSPLADLGYDISDYDSIAPEYGTDADFDALVAAAHERGLRVLMDLVVSHTSTAHPWFREHPDRYIWADGAGAGGGDGPGGEQPPNNWRSAFGGPAWSRDLSAGRWYLHSFYPEQADLDWRNPELRRAIGEMVGRWVARGVDGFRVDAVQAMVKDAQLRDDPPAERPFALPLHGDHAELEHRYSTNDPEVAMALESLRAAAGDALLVGEVYLPNAELGPYLGEGGEGDGSGALDLAFGFELLHSPWEAGRLRAAIAGAPPDRIAWVLSNHDFSRLATRLGPERAAAAAVLLLTLPGPAFIYQGDEIGMVDGPGGDPPRDRVGRDAYRHPMQWDGSPLGGFTSGDESWLPLTDPAARNVADQAARDDSLLALYRRLIALRPRLGEFELLGTPGEVPDGVLAYRRGDYVIAIADRRR